MEYYEKLKETRIDKDITQEQIGQAIGISKQQYGKYENGTHLMPIPYLQKACIFLRISADYILGLPKGLDYPKR